MHSLCSPLSLLPSFTVSSPLPHSLLLSFVLLAATFCPLAPPSFPLRALSFYSLHSLGDVYFITQRLLHLFLTPRSFVPDLPVLQSVLALPGTPQRPSLALQNCFMIVLPASSEGFAYISLFFLAYLSLICCFLVSYLLIFPQSLSPLCFLVSSLPLSSAVMV